MTKSTLIITVLAVALLLLIWLAPVIDSELFQWLTCGWQWSLTALIILPYVLTLIWKIVRRRNTRTFAERTVVHEDQAQGKRQLINDWKDLWKTLTKRHGNNPYTLPWLMIIGTDGSGKSGWLIDAGFEKITAAGPDQKSGIFFWLGEHAVIVELAGHYYTRDKEQLDEYLWNHLIALLKKKRPRRPLTGILSALSADQLVLRQPTGLLEQARQLRWRLLALNRQFGMKLPVWFLLTQADRLNGFAELFRRMSSQRQMQPWGFFLHEGYRRDQFQQAFDQCHKELSDALFDCIHHEKNSNARQAQVRYVLQFTLLGERLRFFCEEIFQSQHGVPSPELKGIWFSSCGQYGNSINLLAAELARLHGFKVVLEQLQIPNNQSYFNQQFFNRILFNDMGSVGENPVARKLWLVKNTLGIAGLSGILVAGLAICWSHIQYNNQLLNQQRIITREYQFSIKQLSIKQAGGKVSPGDIIQPLSRLQSLNRLYQQSARWKHHAGLLDWKTSEAVQSVYLQQLKQKLFKPLTELFHNQLQISETQHSERLFDDLQYYMMLFRPEIRDTELLQNHIQRMLLQKQDPEQNEIDKLNSLLADIWRMDIKNVYPDQRLISRASLVLSTQSDERLIYDHIRALPEFSGTLTMEELFGNEFASLFTVDTERGSAEFPRIYTRNLYASLNLSVTSPLLKQEMANLNRIQKGFADVSLAELTRVSRRIREFYFQDYIQVWSDLISRIRLRPANNLSQIERQVTMLGKENSALLSSLFNTVSSETTLAETSSTPDALTLSREAQKISTSAKVQKTARIINRTSYLLPSKNISPDNPAIVNQAFSEYASYGSGLQTRLSPVLNALFLELQGVNEHFDHNLALYNLSVAVIDSNKSALLDLWQQAASDDTQARQWLNQLANQIWAQAISGASRHCQNRWQQEVYPFWSQYLLNRFPLMNKTDNEVQISDLMEFFKPKGLLDSFVSTTLTPFLLKSSSGWHPKMVRGQQLPVSKSLLSQLVNARHLQQQLFNADGTLQINYRMRCLELTAEATELSLRDSNGRFVYRHGPRLWQKRQWPGQESEQLTVTMSNNSLKLTQQSYMGAWAWLRFVFDCKQWQNGDKLELLYSSKGYSTQLELDLKRRGNPFNPQLYSKIQMPEKIMK